MIKHAKDVKEKLNGGNPDDLLSRPPKQQQIINQKSQ